MRTLITCCAIIMAFYTADAQKSLKIDGEWSQGSITLSDGATVSGLVNYDKKHGVAYYDNGENTIAYKNADILMMSFFDKNFNRKRTFYSLPYDDNAALFEAMAEFKKVVMLSIMGPIREREKHLGNFGAFSFRTYMPGKSRSLSESAQIETIFLMNTEGTMKPYMDILHKEDGEVSLFTWQDEKSKVLDTYEESLSEVLSSEVYASLEKYADENHLSFKSRKDFLEILVNNRAVLDK